MQIVIRLFKYLFIFLITLSFVCFAALSYLNSNYAKPQIAEAIGKSLSKISGSEVSIEEISFSFPNTIILTNIALAQNLSPWATAKKISINLSPAEILKGIISIKSVELDDLHLIDLPTTDPQQPPFSLASINLKTSLPLTLEEIKINHAVLSSKFTTEQIPNGLQIYAAIYPNLSKGSITSTFLIGPTGDAKESLSKIDLSLIQHNSTLTIAYEIHESKTGLISEIINYPLPDNLHVQGQITSSFGKLQSILDGDVESNPTRTLEGSFAINLGAQIKGKGHVQLFADRSLELTIEEGNFEALNVNGLVHLSPKLSIDETKLIISSKNGEILRRWVSFPIEFSDFKTQLELSGNIERLHVLLNFSANNLTYESAIAKNILGSMDCSQTNNEWEGKLQIEGSIENTPIALSTHFNWTPADTISLSNLSISGNDSLIQGGLTYEQPSGWLEADLQGNTALSLWRHWLPQDLDGNIALSAHWSQSPTPSIHIQVESSELTHQHVLLKDVSVIATLSGLFDPSFKSLQGKVYSSIGQLINNDVTLNSVTVATTINGQNDPWPFIFSIGKNQSDAASLDAEGTWLLQENVLSLHVDLLQGKVFDIPLTGSFQVNINEHGLKFIGNAIPVNHPPLHLEAQLPVALSLYPFDLNVDHKAPIAGKAQIAGEIQTLMQLISVDAINLSGSTQISAALSGTLESPIINGLANISNGTFDIFDIGAELKNLSASFESKGREVVLKELIASDKFGGIFKGTGGISLDLSNHFPFYIDFAIQNLSLLELDFIKGAFTGNLLFKGDFKGASITGTAVANSVAVTIPEQTAAVTNSVDVTYINLPEHEKAPVIETDSPWPLNLEINVNAPENVSVRSTDLTSAWKGNLTVKGPVTNLSYIGNFKVTKGKYLFNGKDYEINQGTISLNGPIDGKSTTTLYVIASKDLGKVKVEAIVKGPVMNPEISFRSNPPMPQREILSWILFGRGTSEISPFQGTQLTESITNLKTNNKGPDVLTKIRNSLGIDRIDISRDENNDNAVSIQVGKYISKNVFVSVNKSDVNRIAVEAALLPNIKLQAQVGDDSEGQILLKWKHDY